MVGSRSRFADGGGVRVEKMVHGLKQFVVEVASFGLFSLEFFREKINYERKDRNLMNAFNVRSPLPLVFGSRIRNPGSDTARDGSRVEHRLSGRPTLGESGFKVTSAPLPLPLLLLTIADVTGNTRSSEQHLANVKMKLVGQIK